MNFNTSLFKSLLIHKNFNASYVKSLLNFTNFNTSLLKSSSKGFHGLPWAPKDSPGFQGPRSLLSIQTSTDYKKTPKNTSLLKSDMSRPETRFIVMRSLIVIVAWAWACVPLVYIYIYIYILLFSRRHATRATWWARLPTLIWNAWRLLFLTGISWCDTVALICSSIFPILLSFSKLLSLPFPISYRFA